MTHGVEQAGLDGKTGERGEKLKERNTELREEDSEGHLRVRESCVRRAEEGREKALSPSSL